MLRTVAMIVMTAAAAGSLAAEPFELQADWWRQPAERTRHTTLVCSFDDAESHDADYARELPLAGGFGMAADVEGAHGLATQVAEKGGHLHFRGGSNVSISRGTLRMLVRGDVWADETPRWLVEARATDRIGVLREPGLLSLVFSRGRRTDEPIARLDLEIGEVGADQWHSVVASWDRDSGRGWIALDGRGVTGSMEFSADHRPAYALYVAGGFGGRGGGMNLPGLTIDDLVVYDQALPLLEAEDGPIPEEDLALLPEAEEGARRTLYFLADLQRWGGWQCLYTWPTLIGSSAQGREHVTRDDYIDNDKGNASPRTAINFLYGYQVLGDYRFLDVGMRTAEFLLAAQDERGFWVHGYRMTVNGIQPAASDRHIKLQDLVQAHPMFYLAYVHRLTGDERYLDAVKRAGEWYLQAQNPNGSWSHHYDAEEGVGKTARGIVGGGEINDAAVNAAIDVMTFMYHMTAEGKYVQAIKRAGDWLVEAQGDEVPLWALQYDAENNPAWARHFEPPAWNVAATKLAVKGLRTVYWLSGDERYLEAIRRTAEWMRENLPDGKMWNHVEPGTGRPVASWNREIYYLDDPEQLAFMQDQPTGVWYLQQTEMLPYVEKVLEQAESETWSPPEMTVEAALEALPGARESARHALDTQNEAGVWVSEKVASFMGSIGAGFAAYSPRVLLLLRYIERARIAMGELEPIYRGNGDLERSAYPEPDWYDVDWEQHTGAEGG